MKTRFFMATALVALVAALGLSSALANRDAAVSGVAFIATTQEADGGFGGFGVGQSVDAILAIRAAGFDPNDFAVDGVTPADFLVAHVDEVSAGPASAAKAAMAAVALGLDPRDVAGVDLIAAVEAGYDASTGQYAEDAFSQALAILGYAATGNSVPADAVGALRGMQHDDGGWGFNGMSDPDTTALAVQALIAAGVSASDDDVAAAVAQLQASQGNDAGWGFDPDESNAASTAFVIQALLAAGENVDGAGYTRGGVTPMAYLVSSQQEDGSFPGFDPAYATIQSVPALVGVTFAEMAGTPITERYPPAVSDPPAPETDDDGAPAPAAPATGTGAAASGSAGVPVLVVAMVTLLAGVGGLFAARTVTASRR